MLYKYLNTALTKNIRGERKPNYSHRCFCFFLFPFFLSQRWCHNLPRFSYAPVANRKTEFTSMPQFHPISAENRHRPMACLRYLSVVQWTPSRIALTSQWFRSRAVWPKQGLPGSFRRFSTRLVFFGSHSNGGAAAVLPLAGQSHEFWQQRQKAVRGERRRLFRGGHSQTTVYYWLVRLAIC